MMMDEMVICVGLPVKDEVKRASGPLKFLIKIQKF